MDSLLADSEETSMLNIGIFTLVIIFIIGLIWAILALFKLNLSIPKRIALLEEQIKNNKKHKAIRNAIKILENDPKNADVHYLLGKVYLLDGRDELALMEYSTVNTISRFSPTCQEAPFRNEIAELYLKFGKGDEALREFILLIQLEPSNPMHYYQAGKITEEKGRTSQAIKYYKKAIEINPNFSDAHSAYGHIMYRKKILIEAKNSLQKAISLNPGNYKAHFSLARIYKDAKNYAKALPGFERARNDPDLKISAIIECGICYLGTHNFTQAKYEFERAITLSSENPNTNEVLHAHYFLATCFEKMRDINSAIQHWEYIHRINKGFHNVSKKLRQYEIFRMHDLIKDFHTASPDDFKRMSKNIAKAMQLSIATLQELPDGIQIVGSENSVGTWNTNRRIPKLLRISRGTEQVPVGEIRKFYDEMRSAGINSGYFISSTQFTNSSIAFAEKHPIDLIDSDTLTSILREADKLEDNSP